MSELRDSIHYSQLARKARQLASGHPDPLVARRLREFALQHDRLSRQLARAETEKVASTGVVKKFFLRS